MNVTIESKTQRIVVTKASGKVTVENAGPMGPSVVPAGGTTGQILVKLSDDDFDVGWADPPA